MKKQTYIEFALLLVLVGVLAFVVVGKFFPEKDNVGSAYPTLEYKEKFDDTDARQVCDYFAVNIFHDPVKALELFRNEQGVSVEQLIRTRDKLLPKGDTIISIEFVKAQHGFTEMPSGIHASVYTYKVKSRDDFQPNLLLDIDVFRENNVFRVLRYGAHTLVQDKALAKSE